MGDARRMPAPAAPRSAPPREPGGEAGAPPPPVAGGSGPPGAAATVAAADAGPSLEPAAVAAAAAAAAALDGRGSVCHVPLCGALLAGVPHEAPSLLQLRQAHVIGVVPVEVVAALGLAGCRWCDSPYPAARPRHGSSPLEAHQRQFRVNPRRRLHPAPAPPPPAADLSAPTAPPSRPPAVAVSSTPPPPPSPLFVGNRAAWARARRAFLGTAAPTADGWATLVASPARTHTAVPLQLRGAWRQLGGEAFAWLRREPEQPLAWLWALTLPSLLLRQPSPASQAGAPPLSLAARSAALLGVDFAAALADRDGGVWSASAPAGGGGGAT